MKPIRWLFAALAALAGGMTVATSSVRADPTASTAASVATPDGSSRAPVSASGTTPVSGTTPASASGTAPVSGTTPVARATSPTIFTFESDLHAPYRLRRVRIWVDGALRYDGPGPLGVPLERGDHLISVSADYQVRDPVFSYVSGYRIEIRSDELVAALDDGRVVVARAVESGGVTTPLERRAEIVWR